MTVQDMSTDVATKTALRILELLAAEGSDDELGTLLADVATGDDTMRLLATFAGAVRDQLNRRQQREAQMTALLESAIDLAALRELDGTLRAIVGRMRKLLRVDVAYLSLVESGNTTINFRVTDGAVTSAFIELRMHITDSLGGLVMATGRPVMSRGYFTDNRIKHKAAIDAAVAAEGLASFLAVPLTLGTHVIGVLYAAHRTDRRFAADEVAIACSLAAHAALACENARLFEQMQRTLNELTEANNTIAAQRDEVSAYAAAHVRLTDLVLQGSSVTKLAQVVSDMLGARPIAILDQRGAILGAVGEPGIDPHDKTVRVAIAQARATGQTSRHGMWYAAVITTPQQEYGSIVARSSVTFSTLEAQAFDHATVVLALLLTLKQIKAETENRIRRDLVDDTLTGHGDDETLVDRARALGTDVEQSYVVVVAASDDPGGLAHAAGMWVSTRPGWLAGKHAGRTILFVPAGEPSKTARSVAAELSRFADQRVTAGADGPARGFSGLRSAYRRALLCLETMLRVGAAGTGAATTDLGFAGLILSDKPNLAEYIEVTIGPLLTYDQSRGSDLITTLRAHLRCDRNINKTAQHLHIHVNTMRQRLDRIAQVIGPDWQTSDRLLEIHVALQLHDVTTALRD